MTKNAIAGPPSQPSQQRRVAVIANAHHPNDRLIIRGISAYMRDYPHWSVYLECDPIFKMPDLREWKGDGLIIHLDTPELVDLIQSWTIPAVGFGADWSADNVRIPYFTNDDGAIGELAAKHLIGLGLKRFAYYEAPPATDRIWSQARADSFSRRIARAGHSCRVLTSQFASNRWNELLSELKTWLQEFELPFGVMACSDRRGRYVLEACRALGLRVPDDVAVLGVDNDDLICELSQPPLTSIETGSLQLGYEAAALLDRMLSGYKPGQTQHCIAPVGLVARQSTDIMAIENADVVAALKLIRSMPCRDLQPERIAEAIGLSRCTLDRRFREALGTTVYEKILSVRLSKAKELLTATDWPLSKIAREAGYASAQYLAAVMRQSTGKSLGEYRMAIKKMRSLAE